jgi:hypothetical protein
MKWWLILGYCWTTPCEGAKASLDNAMSELFLSTGFHGLHNTDGPLYRDVAGARNHLGCVDSAHYTHNAVSHYTLSTLLDHEDERQNLPVYSWRFVQSQASPLLPASYV